MSRQFQLVRAANNSLNVLLNFYRAMRMHNADYAVVRCLSVRLSVCHIPVLRRNG